MKLYRTLAIARKEWIHLVRDFRSLLLAITTPLFLLLLFGYALTFDVDHVPLVIWDQNNTETSQDFISHFAGSRYFTITKYVDNYKAIEDEIDHDRALIALIIPSDFTKNIKRDTPSAVQIIADGSNSNTATLALGYASEVAKLYSSELIYKFYEKQGKKIKGLTIDFRPRVWFNEELRSQNNIIPGLIAVIMMVVTALFTSLTITREKERGTMELLISTPIKVPELLFGKMIPYFFIGLVDVALIMLVGEFAFHVPLRGSLMLIFCFTTIFLIGVLSFGMLISIVASSQLVASQMAMVFTFLPSFLLSGFFNKITNMPTFVQYITYVVPARYFMELLRGIYLKGVGLEVLYKEALFLVLFTVLMVMLILKTFKKKLE